MCGGERVNERGANGCDEEQARGEITSPQSPWAQWVSVETKTLKNTAILDFTAFDLISASQHPGSVHCLPPSFASSHSGGHW